MNDKIFIFLFYNYKYNSFNQIAEKFFDKNDIKQLLRLYLNQFKLCVLYFCMIKKKNVHD